VSKVGARNLFVLVCEFEIVNLNREYRKTSKGLSTPASYDNEFRIIIFDLTWCTGLASALPLPLE
jgi:hypothetical protein